jgi:serine/threonine protein kinase
LAIEAIHSLSYVHRDIKLENLLICKDGYIKITDFGFAKFIAAGSKTKTLVGTPEYLAPEIILAKGHNRAVDYWALGIVTYELLISKTPFAQNDQMAMFTRIVHCENSLAFPKSVEGTEACSIVRMLLCKNPALRLGMLSGGVSDIKRHKYFSGVSWSKLVEKLYKLPFRPTKFKKVKACKEFDASKGFNQNCESSTTEVVAACTGMFENF